MIQVNHPFQPKGAAPRREAVASSVPDQVTLGEDTGRKSGGLMKAAAAAFGFLSVVGAGGTAYAQEPPQTTRVQTTTRTTTTTDSNTTQTQTTTPAPAPIVHTVPTDEQPVA